MLRRLTRDLVGGALIVGGALLAGTMFADQLPGGAWGVALTLTALGVTLLGLYAAARRWWLLPLGCALTTVGLLQVLYRADLDHFFAIWGVSLAGLGGLFVGLYLNKSEQWGWLMPGFVFWTVGGGLLIAGLASAAPEPFSGWTLTLALWLFAVQLTVIFAGNRRAWWAFGLAYLLWAAGAGLRLTGGALYDEALLTWGLWALALLYWLNYLRDDTRTGRLWVAGALTVGGALPLFFLPGPSFWPWLALGVTAAVGLAWAAVWWRRRSNQAG
jgi:hypothetical protein